MDNVVVIREIEEGAFWQIENHCASLQIPAFATPRGNASWIGTERTLKDAIKKARQLDYEYGIDFVFLDDEPSYGVPGGCIG